jgi:hypothetical protein
MFSNRKVVHLIVCIDETKTETETETKTNTQIKSDAQNLDA